MIVLHVGPHKTATTWLQANFHAHRKALKARGWLYPQTGERVRIAHHDISDRSAQILDPGSDLVAELKVIAASARAENLSVLLSSEGFAKWKLEHFQALGAVMGEPLHIVFALRDPISLAQSFWAQKVKTGVKMTLPEFYQRQIALSGKGEIARPIAELEKLKAAADGQLTILAFDEIRRLKLDIFTVFLNHVLNITDVEPSPDATQNERDPIELTEFMRLLPIENRRVRSVKGLNVGRALQHLVTAAKRKTIVKTLGAVKNARRTLEISRDTPEFLDLETQLMTMFGDRMVPRPSQQLFLRGVETLTYLDEATLRADPAVSRLLDEMAGTLAPSGLRMRIGDWIHRWLVGWRRFLKRLGLRK